MTNEAATNYDVPPVIVHMVKDDTKVQERPKETRTSHRTITLTAANPYQQIAGVDPARLRIQLNVIDNNPVVVSGDIGQASDLNNTAATITAPNGRMITSAMGETNIPGQDEMWLSAGVFPTKVGMTIVRQI